MNLTVSVHGRKVVLGNLLGLAADYPLAIQRGLSKSVKGIHRLAFGFLSGAGSKGTYVTSKGGNRYWKRRATPIPGGGYPVPVRTGNLRRLLDFVEPGTSKNSNGQTFTADPMSAIIYNAAEYSRVVHAGLGSSAKFGPRQYLYDALEQFNQGDRIAENITEEIAVDITKRGLA